MKTTENNAQNQDFLPVKSKSGNITGACYNSTEKRMTISFKGGRIYSYENVQPEKWNEFADTFKKEEDSTGSYFHKNFRHLPCTWDNKPKDSEK